MVDRLPLLAGTPSPTPEAAGWPQPQEGSFHGILWLQPRIPVCFFFWNHNLSGSCWPLPRRC